MKAIYTCIYKYSPHSQQHCCFHFSEGITKTISNKTVVATVSLRGKKKKKEDHLCVSTQISTVGDISISLRSVIVFHFQVLEISLRYICITNWVEGFKCLKLCPTFLCKKLHLLLANLHPNCYNPCLKHQEKCVTLTVKGSIFKV